MARGIQNYIRIQNKNSLGLNFVNDKLNNHFWMKLSQGPIDHGDTQKYNFTSLLSIGADIDTPHRHQNKR